MANRVQSILQIWDDDRNQWETVYASQATPTTTTTAINNGAGYNASATSLTVDSTTGILSGDYIKIGNELLQVGTVASGTVLNPVTRGQLTGTAGGVSAAGALMLDDAVVTKMRLGPSALFHTQIKEKHGNPQICTLELFNRPHTTGSTEGYVEDRYATYLNEYDRIRVLDNNSKAILFYGRIYRKDIEFDQRYGSIIRITAFDALKELADNRIEGAKGSFTSQTTRSAIVDKIVEKLTYQNASDVNVNLSTDDTQKFTTSVATMSATNKWDYSKGRATGLSAISEVAGGDPHDASSTPSTENGYSYFVDNGFTSSLKTTNYTAATPTLNYFKRGSFPDSSASGHSIRPTAQTFYKMTYGTAESDGDSTNSYTTTVNTMSSFSVSKQYTDVISAVTLTYKENNGEVATKTCYRAKVSGVAGTESGAFDSNVLFTTNDSNPETAAPADQTSIANSPIISIDTSTSSYTPLVVGRLIYITATSGNDKFIVFTIDDPHNPEDLHESVLSAASKTSDFIRVDAYTTTPSGDPVSTGANRFTVDTTSDVDVELLRTVPATFDASTSPMEIRKAVSQMFASAQTTTPAKRADLSIIDFPFARLTVDFSSRSGNVLTLPVDLYKFGVRKGMVVRQRKSGAETGNYGYISAIVSHASSPTITVVLNNEAGNATAGTTLPWADSDTFDVYIPIRPGYTAYLTNAPANLTADGLITGIDYSEGMGIQTTFMSLITDNFAALNETGHTVPVGGASATPVSPDSRKQVFYTVTAGATTPMLSLPGTSDDYRQVNWAAGTLTVGVEEYSIAASNSTAALGGSAYLANNQWYVLYFNKNESTTALKVSSLANLPQDVDLIRLAQLTASASTDGDARWRLDSGEAVMSAEVATSIDIADISDGAIGSAKFVRGAQPFSLISASGAATDVWSTSAYNAVAWTGGTLKYSDGDTLTVNSGSATGLSANTSYWAYVTTTTGNITVTTTSTDAVGDTKILLALIKVGGSGDVGASIAPIGTQAHLTTAASIKAGAVTGDSIKTGTIVAGNIAADAIASAKIATGAVIADSIAAGAIIADKIGANEITAGKLEASLTLATTLIAGGGTVTIDANGVKVNNALGSGSTTAALFFTNGNVTTQANAGIIGLLRSGLGDAMYLESPATIGSGSTDFSFLRRNSAYGSGSTSAGAGAMRLNFGSTSYTTKHTLRFSGQEDSDLYIEANNADTDSNGTIVRGRVVIDNYAGITVEDGTYSAPSVTFDGSADGHSGIFLYESGSYEYVGITGDGTVAAYFGENGAGIYVYENVLPGTTNSYDLGWNDGGGGTDYDYRNIYSVNALSVSSDRRLKEDIQPANLGLSFVNDLTPVSYRWKEKHDDVMDQRHYGLIAQDVVEVLKDHGIDSLKDFGGILHSGKKEQMYKAKYEHFIPILIKAVQELSTEVKELKEKN